MKVKHLAERWNLNSKQVYNKSFVLSCDIIIFFNWVGGEPPYPHLDHTSQCQVAHLEISYWRFIYK